MEFESLAQSDQIGAAVVGDGEAVRHLRLYFEFIVHTEQQIIDRPAMIHRRLSRGENRIQQ